ncbi:siderophore-interacting protein [Arachnia propionica]|uniref:Siderophore-interacting protein n=1 Tax=Arachnia propionica TaxID=1750 RepID=A0A3P1T7L5_9ACTN|nr:siderophore-interacting protein [Arachnia propionica]RRD04433.1 siderophore-interacting protein [Arachnia propionica]
MSRFVPVVATVTQVERLSPGFVRITFATPPGFGGSGPVWDQRIKVLVPGTAGVFRHDGPDWYEVWSALPEAERGAMRTYSIRSLAQTAQCATVVVDFVLHLAHGATGPASAWAASAAVGDQVTLVGPSGGGERVGVEFAPGGAERLVLAGDETAAPAMARILEDLPRDACGVALIEVPTAADRVPIDAPSGFEVTWLPREGADHGALLAPRVLSLAPGDGGVGGVVAGEDPEEIWETPTYSGLGEELPGAVASSGTYWWIAGEAGVVAGLRRTLVRDHGIERCRIAFMGYWKRGRAQG